MSTAITPEALTGEPITLGTTDGTQCIVWPSCGLAYSKTCVHCGDPIRVAPAQPAQQPGVYKWKALEVDLSNFHYCRGYKTGLPMWQSAMSLCTMRAQDKISDKLFVEKLQDLIDHHA